MTPVEKENAALREQLADALKRGNEAIDLATEMSLKVDQATSLATAAAAHLGAAKPEKPPAAAPPTPPTPAAPPPPLPTFREFINAPSHEKARLRAIHGDDLEERLGLEWDRQNTMRNMRGGAGREDRRLTSQIVADRNAPAPKFDPDQFDPPHVSAQKWRARTTADYEAGQKALAALPEGHPLRAALASANAAGNPGGRTAPAPPRSLSNAAPASRGRTKFLPR